MHDLAAIERLVLRYAGCVDRADWDGIGLLLAGAEVRIHPGDEVVRGAEDIRAQWSSRNKLHADGTPRTKHLVTNIVVTVDEGGFEAVARSYFVSLQATDRIPLQPIVAGRYVDRFRRDGTGWAFSVKEIFVDLVGDTTDNLTA